MHFERPGDHHRNDKSKGEKNDKHLHHPGWSFKGGPQRSGRDLDEQPADRGVRHRHFVDVAPLQLGEEVCRSSLWFLFAEFLEARIIPERIEHWIEPEQRWSEWYVLRQLARVRYRKQFF